MKDRESKDSKRRNKKKVKSIGRSSCRSGTSQIPVGKMAGRRKMESCGRQRREGKSCPRKEAKGNEETG